MGMGNLGFPYFLSISKISENVKKIEMLFPKKYKSIK
jgi:hypothetical protein